MVSVGGMIVPAWAKWLGLAFGLALLVWAACWLNVRYFINPAVNAETARWNERWDKRDLADKQAEIDAQRARTALERQRQDEIDKIQADAQREADRLNALRTAANRNAMQLQQGVEAAIASLRTGQAASLTGSSKAGNATSVLLAQLYRELNAAAIDYAGEADRARAAGLTCERAWDAMRAGATPTP